MNLEAAFKSGFYFREIEAHDASDLNEWNDVLVFPVVNGASGDAYCLGQLFGIEVNRFDESRDRNRIFCRHGDNGLPVAVLRRMTPRFKSHANGSAPFEAELDQTTSAAISSDTRRCLRIPLFSLFLVSV